MLFKQGGAMKATGRSMVLASTFLFFVTLPLVVQSQQPFTVAELLESASPSAQEEAMSQSKYPAGWDEDRVRRVLEHYETRTDEEAVAEDEAADEATTHAAMGVPIELVSVVRELIAKRRAGSNDIDDLS
jgi:hypothetical protein